MYVFFFFKFYFLEIHECVINVQMGLDGGLLGSPSPNHRFVDPEVTTSCSIAKLLGEPADGELEGGGKCSSWHDDDLIDVEVEERRLSSNDVNTSNWIERKVNSISSPSF